MREAIQEEREGVEMYIGSIADIAPSKWMAENLCDDCISRQEAIDAIWDGVNMDIYTREVKECLEKLPPVTPAEKVGRWISFGIQGEIDGQIVRAFTCSKCGAISIFRMASGKIVNGDLCPNCGAKMQEVEE